LRRVLLLTLLLGLLVLGWMSWRTALSRRQAAETPQPVIVKEPANFVIRTFDPAAPPAEMPPMTPGEDAECDSNFLSNANVSGETERSDAAHATLNITKIKMTLQLNVTVWVPAGVSQHVMEHEEGHRQISEYYYQSADQLAGQIAARYMGKQIDLSGADLNAESQKALQQTAAEITEEFGKELNTQPAQLLYDTITDHSRNGVAAGDAVAHALKSASIESGK
jgi:hypothetical protein